MPKQPAFAKQFKELSGSILLMSELFVDFNRSFQDFASYTAKAAEIESSADNITHGVIRELNQSFITPFDREDIYSLAHEMDEIVDLIENTIQNVELYGIREKSDIMERFSLLIMEASRQLGALIDECFFHEKHTAKAKELMIKIHELEDQGDHLFQEGIKKLFAEEKDPLTVIKWKDVYEDLEEIMDTFQHVSNTMEGIIVKSS